MKTIEDLTLTFYCVCACPDQSVADIFQTDTTQKGKKLLN